MKKKLIVGSGVSGKSVYDTCQKFNIPCALYGEGLGDPNKQQTFRGVPHYPQESTVMENVPFADFDEVVASPGIPDSHPLLRAAMQKSINITTEIDFVGQILSAHQLLPPVIAVTGSFGKTTTCEIIAHFLQRLGLKVFLGGNIGTPLSELIDSNQKYDFAVLELSSFQLERTHHLRPSFAGITNIVMHHQERYQHFQEYYNAKMRLFELYQKSSSNGVFIFPDDPLPDLPFSILGKTLPTYLQKNCAFAYKMVQKIVPAFSPKDAIQFMKDYVPAPYRLQLIAENENYVVFNDAKSTGLRSVREAIAGVNSLYPHASLTLMMGGQVRDPQSQQTELMTFLSEVFEKAKAPLNLYLFGELKSKLSISPLPEGAVYLSIREGVNIFFEKLQKFSAKEGREVLLFSPGFPSFDEFSNYIARGNYFSELVAEFS